MVPEEIRIILRLYSGSIFLIVLSLLLFFVSIYMCLPKEKPQESFIFITINEGPGGVDPRPSPGGMNGISG